MQTADEAWRYWISTRRFAKDQQVWMREIFMAGWAAAKRASTPPATKENNDESE